MEDRWTVLRTVLRAIARLRVAGADLVLGSFCAGCARPGLILCDECARWVAGLPVRCVGRAALPSCWVVGDYDGRLARLVAAHKQARSRRLTSALGEAVARVARSQEISGPLVVVPVPTSRRAIRRRGHDHTMRLARATCRALRRRGIPARARPWLRRSAAVRDQVGLGRRERLANQRGSMTWRGSGDAAVVLVDDVVTTGATVAEAWRACASASATPVLAVAVAQTPDAAPTPE